MGNEGIGGRGVSGPADIGGRGTGAGGLIDGLTDRQAGRLSQTNCHRQIDGQTGRLSRTDRGTGKLSQTACQIDRLTITDRPTVTDRLSQKADRLSQTDCRTHTDRDCHRQTVADR